jgi:hypothetical protein
MAQRYYSRREAAELFGVCEETISHWVKKGVLKNANKNIHGGLRITAKSVQVAMDNCEDFVDQEKAISEYKKEIELKRKRMEKERDKYEAMLCGYTLRSYAYVNARMLNSTMADVLRVFVDKAGLAEREKDIIVSLCNHSSIEDVAERYGLTCARVQQIAHKAVRRLQYRIKKHESYLEEIIKDRERIRQLEYEVSVLNKENQSLRASIGMKERDGGSVMVPKLLMMPLYDSGISVRLVHALLSIEVQCLLQVMHIDKMRLLRNIRNFGKKTAIELEDIFESVGLQLGADSLESSSFPVVEGVEYEEVSMAYISHHRDRVDKKLKRR